MEVSGELYARSQRDGTFHAIDAADVVWPTVHIEVGWREKPELKLLSGIIYANPTLHTKRRTPPKRKRQRKKENQKYADVIANITF